MSLGLCHLWKKQGDYLTLQYYFDDDTSRIVFKKNDNIDLRKEDLQMCWDASICFSNSTLCIIRECPGRWVGTFMSIGSKMYSLQTGSLKWLWQLMVNHSYASKAKSVWPQLLDCLDTISSTKNVQENIECMHSLDHVKVAWGLQTWYACLFAFTRRFVNLQKVVMILRP